MSRKSQGFTLLEVMITVVIVGILSAIALPAYTSYVTRSRLTEAFTALAAVQPQAEQFWASNRTYEDFNRVPSDTANFTFALSNDTASTYTITATGVAKMDGFVYTINQAGVRATTGAPDGWTTSASCWVDRKDGSCVQ